MPSRSLKNQRRGFDHDLRLLEEWGKSATNCGTARMCKNHIGKQLRGGNSLKYVECLLEQLVTEGRMTATEITGRLNRIGQYTAMREPIVLPEDDYVPGLGGD
jgi:hypothetical protein